MLNFRSLYSSCLTLQIEQNEMHLPMDKGKIKLYHTVVLLVFKQLASEIGFFKMLQASQYNSSMHE